MLTGRVAHRHRLALLALLACTRHHVLARDKLIGLLWPEADTASARGLLSASAHAIRKALGDEVLISEGETLRLDVSRTRIDTRELEQSFAAGDYERVVASHTGLFLDGFSIPDSPGFDEWMDEERRRLARLYHTSLGKLAEQASAAGEAAASAEWWRQRLACTPADARVVLKLMDALARAGDRAGALQVSRAHARLMSAEFDTSPDPDVLALERELRSPEPVSAHSPVAAPPSSERDESVGGPTSPSETPRKPAESAVHRHPVQRLVTVAIVIGIALGVSWYTTLRGGPAAVDERSVLVLPFDDYGSGQDAAYFVEGMYAAVHAELSRIRSLRVLSRTTATHYKTIGASLSEISRDLNVNGTVEAAAFRWGDSVRIEVQLWGTNPERSLWSGSYDRHIRDVLALHAEIARRIADEIEATLGPQEAARLADTRTVRPEAYESWLRAAYHRSRWTGNDYLECVRYGNEAVKLDSTFAPAYAVLAQCYISGTFIASSPPRPMFDSAKAAARRAIALDPTLSTGHAALASALAHHDWDWEGAERAYREALERNRSSDEALIGLAWILAWRKRFDEALEIARTAERLDPLSPRTPLQIGMINHLARRNEAALAGAQRALVLDSTFMFAWDRLHWAYHGLGAYDEAIAAAERAVALSGERDHRRRGFLANAYGRAGRRADALAILNDLLELRRTTYVPPTGLAAAYVGLGESEAAIRWLELGYEERDGDMVLLNTFPLWDPLREDPRFRSLLARMRFPD